MRMRSLEAFGVPPQLLTVWEKYLSEELLPLQERAVVQHRVLSGQSLMVQAPTSAGKTFIGEMAASQAALASRKTLYLVPTRALAEDKYAHFSRLYAPLGLRVIITTRDRRSDDRRFTTGDFDIAIAIPEKVRALWARSGVSQFLGLAVIDELQGLSEPERGPCLELILAELRRMPGVQIIGLSACLGSSPRLAEYLRAGWLESNERPVELRRGVMRGDEFRYCDTSGTWHTECFPGVGPREGDTHAEAAARLALHLAHQGEPTIIFVRDRASALHLAVYLAECSGQADERRPLALEGLETTAVREQLQRLMAVGVAFHSADLQFEDRHTVEQSFLSGQVRVLCSTPTLALGVNLPARNVIIDPQGWQSQTPDLPSTLSPISRSDYENRAGRAGRLGHGEFGRAFLLADTDLTAEALIGRYLTGPLEPSQPALGTLLPTGAVLNLATGTAAQRGLAEVYTGTLTAFLQQDTRLPEALVEAAERCLRRGLLRPTEEGGLQTSATGRIAAASGVSFPTVCWLHKWIEQGMGAPTNLEATLLAALSVEAQQCPSWGLGGRIDHLELLREYAADNAAHGALLEALLSSPEYEWRVRDRAARLTLALQRWLTLEETYDLEMSLRLSAARLMELGEVVGWVVDTLAEFGAEYGWAATACARLRLHAECLATGLPPEGLPLARLRVFGLGRNHINQLCREGLQQPADLVAVGLPLLQQLLPEQLATELLEVAMNRLRPARSKLSRQTRTPAQPVTGLPLVSSNSALGAPSPTVAEMPALVLDDGRPDRALVFGSTVPLRPAEFRLLRALAEQPGKCLRYEALYNRLWEGDRFAEPGQIYSHRSRLCRKLANLLPGDQAKDLLVTVPKHGLMLNLRSEEVRVC